MDVVVIIFVLAALAVMIFKRYDSFIYYIAFSDILFRILDFIANNLPIKFLSDFLNNYFPNSLYHIITLYSSGIFTTVLLWVLLVIYIIFDIYLLKAVWHKK